MGNLKDFDLNNFINPFNLKVFFETGTSDGKGVREAQKYGFNRIYSVEIIEAQAKKMQEEFAGDAKVEIIHDNSANALTTRLPLIEEPILIFLDAHFPGADCGYAKHDDDIDEDLRLPLEKELEIIKETRKGKRDVILIDDIRIYIDQGRQCWRDDIKPRKKFSSDRFFLEVLSETHNGNIINADTGYCILTPK